MDEKGIEIRFIIHAEQTKRIEKLIPLYYASITEFVKDAVRKELERRERPYDLFEEDML